MKKNELAVANPVEWVEDAAKAVVLMHPMRLQIVRLAVAPMSASELADRLGLPRQRVNYHVRELARAGFLRRSGARRKRNLIERLYVASARSYMLGPGVLGPAAPAADALTAANAPEVTHLMALAARTQAEVARAAKSAMRRSQSMPLLTASTEFRFATAKQRADFVSALTAALARLVEDHTQPLHGPDGQPAPGRPHRLVLFCHPFIPDSSDAPVQAGGTEPA